MADQYEDRNRAAKPVVEDPNHLLPAHGSEDASTPRAFHEAPAGRKPISDPAHMLPAKGSTDEKGGHKKLIIFVLVVLAIAVLAFLFGWLPEHNRNKQLKKEADARKNADPVVEVMQVKAARQRRWTRCSRHDDGPDRGLCLCARERIPQAALRRHWRPCRRRSIAGADRCAGSRPAGGPGARAGASGRSAARTAEGQSRARASHRRSLSGAGGEGCFLAPAGRSAGSQSTRATGQCCRGCAQRGSLQSQLAPYDRAAKL